MNSVQCQMTSFSFENFPTFKCWNFGTNTSNYYKEIAELVTYASLVNFP